MINNNYSLSDLRSERAKLVRIQQKEYQTRGNTQRCQELFSQIEKIDAEIKAREDNNMSYYQQRKAQLRDEAIEWQNKIYSEYGTTWGDIARHQSYFEKYGKVYGLLQEFRENGII